jgi:hypothetical protein
LEVSSIDPLIGQRTLVATGNGIPVAGAPDGTIYVADFVAGVIH